MVPPELALQFQFFLCEEPKFLHVPVLFFICFWLCIRDVINLYICCFSKICDMSPVIHHVLSTVYDILLLATCTSEIFQRVECCVWYGAAVNVPFAPSLGQPAATSSITRSTSVRFFPFLFTLCSLDIFWRCIWRCLHVHALIIFNIFELFIVKNSKKMDKDSKHPGMSVFR